ncbi:MAG: tetratricopeptide repeat protein, partial [Planctomycetota bacterium]
MKLIIFILLASFFFPLMLIGEDNHPQVSLETEEDIAYLNDIIRDGYRGKYRNAERDLEEYLEEFPHSERALGGMIMVQRISGDYQGALKHTALWRSLNPESVEALLAEVELWMMTGRYERASTCMKEAESLEDSLGVQTLKARVLHETGKRQ